MGRPANNHTLVSSLTQPSLATCPPAPLRTRDRNKQAKMALLRFEAQPLVLAGGALLLLATWLVASTIRQYIRLRHIPGPPIAGFTQFWLIRCVGGGRTHLDLWEAAQKYGT